MVIHVISIVINELIICMLKFSCSGINKQAINSSFLASLLTRKVDTLAFL